MILVGLTGSIAMGKSTVAAMFASRGVPVFDSDAAVHGFYSWNGQAVEPISRIAPDAVKNAIVERTALSALLRRDPSLLNKIEAVVHPLVHKAQNEFISTARQAGAPFVILDIPLLFESGRTGSVDKIIVVSAPLEVQRTRALDRPNMSPEKFEFIVSRQTPDSEKRDRANFVVDTSGTLDNTRRQVVYIISKLLTTYKESSDA